MIAFGTCPLCTSQVGFRLCSDRHTVALVCEDCAMIWAHPSRFGVDDALDPLDPQLKRKHPGIQLRPSRWARENEIEEAGWGAYLLKPGDAAGGTEPRPAVPPSN